MRSLTWIVSIVLITGIGTIETIGTIASPQPTDKSPHSAAVPPERDASEPLYQAAVTLAKTSSGQLDESEVRSAVLDKVEAALRAGACPTRTLTEAAFGTLHTDSRFRALIRDHARQWEISMTVPDEPGEKLRVDGVVRDAAGMPVTDALVYAYHTDARGIYSEQGSDAPRIFGYMRTDANGRFAFNTIRPASYPGQPHEFDQHIHYVVTARGFRERQTASSFADDPHWQGKTLPKDAQPVTKNDQGVDSCRVEIIVQKRLD
jgi:protocatechuate 3,4-dioxygenase beta subunit